jgi:hypothetical protein
MSGQRRKWNTFLFSAPAEGCDANVAPAAAAREPDRWIEAIGRRHHVPFIL